MSEDNQGNAAAVIDAIQKYELGKARIVNVHDDDGNDVEAYIHPLTGDLESVESLINGRRLVPQFRAGVVSVSMLDNFIQLVNRDSGEDSLIFVEVNPPRMTAILDYHAAGGVDEGPRWCRNRVVYPFPLSTEWKLWMQANARSMPQAEFAAYIEDHLFDIGETENAGEISSTWARKMAVHLAGPSALMAVARGLSVRVDETVTNAVKLETGETSFVWSTEHKNADASQRIPAAFHIRIPVLDGGPLYSIPARLRYRIASGKVSWFYELHRPDLFLRDAIKDSVDRVAREEATDSDMEPGGTGLSIIMGTPPS